MCYQHHERPDGKGFPVGLMSDEIHEASKICAVANRYEGLTSDCSHRQAMTRLAALRVLESEKNTALDSEMIQFPTTQVIVKNLSRTGFSVLADRQWYPEQCVKIYFSSAIATATVICAKRLGNRCYDIGFRIATFRNFES